MYTLINAVKMNREHPQTFHIPSVSEIENLKVGDFVKLGFQEEGNGTERMWVKITNKKTNGEYEGFLDNNPFSLETVKYKDKVSFKGSHVLGYMS